MFNKLWLTIRKRLGWQTATRKLQLDCENCGELLTSPHFCRACGASEESGWAAPDWSEDTDDDFDYDDFVRREFGRRQGRRQGRPRNVAATVWGTILILLLVIGMLLAQFAGGF